MYLVGIVQVVHTYSNKTCYLLSICSCEGRTDMLIPVVTIRV